MPPEPYYLVGRYGEIENEIDNNLDNLYPIIWWEGTMKSRMRLRYDEIENEIDNLEARKILFPQS